MNFLKPCGAVSAALLAPAALKANAPNTLLLPSNPRLLAAMLFGFETGGPLASLRKTR
jgi:hypothetical protein